MSSFIAKKLDIGICGKEVAMLRIAVDEPSQLSERDSLGVLDLLEHTPAPEALPEHALRSS
jgi:hypothetical protein